jgi:hypothetical protein
MTLDVRIFLQSEISVTKENKTKQHQHIETTRLQINKRPQTTRKTQSKEVKNPHRLNQNENTKTM